MVYARCYVLLQKNQMQKNLAKPAMLMVLLVVAVIGGWEICLRQRGISIAYDDGGPMWSDKRAMVYEDKADVFIGSSRIKYDLDVDTWKQLTGRHAVQLSLEGHSPLPFLLDLADDPKFRGRLVVDVTELLYFSDCILRDRQPEPSGVEGLRDVHIIRSLYQSVNTHAPVKLEQIQRQHHPRLKQEIYRPRIVKPKLFHVSAPTA